MSLALYLSRVRSSEVLGLVLPSNFDWKQPNIYDLGFVRAAHLKVVVPSWIVSEHPRLNLRLPRSHFHGADSRKHIDSACSRSPWKPCSSRIFHCADSIVRRRNVQLANSIERKGI